MDKRAPQRRLGSLPPEGRTRLLALGTALAATAAAALWAASGKESASTPAALAPVPVQMAVVRPEGTATASGAAFTAVLHHDREARLAFRLPGRIEALPARIGNRLPQGAVVARLEPDVYAAAAQRAAADAARAGRAAERLAGLARDGAAPGAQAGDARDLATAAEAGLAAARADLKATRLTMPFPGTVIERLAEQGEVVGAGQALLTIADTASPLLARAQVPAALAARLRPGQAGTVRLADGRELAARVLRKAAGADARTGLATVELALAGSSGALSGAPASVRFPTAASGPDAADGVQRIPAEALIEAQGSTAYVYVIDQGGHARRRPVRLLGLADRDARIAGLPADARVVTLGAGFVRDGQRVEVTR